MPTTSPWNIPFPDGPTNLTALQSHFANIANAVNNALTTGLGGAPRLASSDSMRATLFPAPIQGDSVVRPDKGYTEQYYALYNASTNPAGAIPAGWYPISGVLPYFYTSGDKVVTWGSTAHIKLDSVNCWETSPVVRSGMAYSAGVVTVPMSGNYRVSTHFVYQANANGPTRRLHVVKNAITTPDVTAKTVLFEEQFAASVMAHMTMALEATIPLAAGDTLAVWTWHNNGNAIGVAPASSAPQNAHAHFGVHYVGPTQG